MKKVINKAIKIFLNKEFLIFLIIGAVNTFNGTLFSTLYSLKFQANVAFVLGYACSLVISYLLNSIFTFKEKLDFSRFIKFCFSYIPNFVVQLISVYIIFNLLGLDKIIAYLAAAIIGIPVTFIILKFYAFAKKKK